MFDISEAKLERVVLHHVGNPSRGGEVISSRRELQLGAEVKDLLRSYFLHAFKLPVWYHFNTGNGAHIPFEQCEGIFSKEEKLLKPSVQIANHLLACSTNPAIKEGDLFVATFSNCVIDGEITEAIGFFKSENKETFLKIFEEENGFSVSGDDGINIHKLDKGCLVFNVDQEMGYRVCIVDTTSRGEEARYWKEDFLRLKPRTDNYFKTQNLMNLCKDFCKDVLVEENNVSPVERIAVMNDSVKFIESHQAFNMPEFEREVLQEPAVIEAFSDYRRNYEPLREMGGAVDAFDIAPEAVKGQKKFFKHVMKLDKNFHVYVHGNAEFIERGFDETRQMKYYKLYYNQETHPE